MALLAQSEAGKDAELLVLATRYQLSLSGSVTIGSGAPVPETVTATANVNVGPTPYWIEIFDETTGTLLGQCGNGSSCSVSFMAAALLGIASGWKAGRVRRRGPAERGEEFAVRSARACAASVVRDGAVLGHLPPYSAPDGPFLTSPGLLGPRARLMPPRCPCPTCAACCRTRHRTRTIADLFRASTPGDMSRLLSLIEERK